MLTALLVSSADGLSTVVNNFFVCLLYRGSENTNIYGIPLRLILYHVEILEII